VNRQASRLDNLMKHVAILIPASPVPAFFSQIAGFSLALQNLRWSRWHPSLRVVMGGEVDHIAVPKPALYSSSYSGW
jgi:hypothetical protein